MKITDVTGVPRFERMTLAVRLSNRWSNALAKSIQRFDCVYIYL